MDCAEHRNAEAAHCPQCLAMYWKAQYDSLKASMGRGEPVDGAVPNMFWDDNAPEESFAEDPCSFADAVSDDMTDYDDVFIVDVRCAQSLPPRKMKVWSEKCEDGHYYTKWEWVK